MTNVDIFEIHKVDIKQLECTFGKIQYIYIHWLNGDFEILKQKFWQSLCFGF